MNNQQRKNKICDTTWSDLHHDLCFIKFFFKDAAPIRKLKAANLIQVKIMTLMPVVDPEGNVFNPSTAIVFFNN